MAIKIFQSIFVKNNTIAMMKNILTRLSFVFVASLFTVSAVAHFKTTPNSPVHITDSGKLVYKAYSNGDVSAFHRLADGED